MKTRIKTTLILLAVFLCLFIIGRDPYLIEWLAGQNFLFVWLPIGALALLGKRIWALCITGGCCLGIVAGQLAENLKDLFYADNPQLWKFHLLGRRCVDLHGHFVSRDRLPNTAAE